MKQNQKKPEGSHWRFLRIAVEAGILIMILLYGVLTENAKKEVAELADETLEYLTDSCVLFDKEQADDQTESLASLYGKTVCIRDFFTTRQLSQTDVLRSYAESQLLSGVLVVDESLSPVGQSDTQAYTMWKTILQTKPVILAAQSTHTSVIDEAVIDGETYQYAVLDRVDAPGLILCYQNITGDIHRRAKVRLAELLEGNNFMMDAVIFISDGTTILSTNRPGCQGIRQQDCLLTSHPEKGKYGLITAEDDHGTWYGKLRTYQEYEVYAFYSEDSVFAHRMAALALAGLLLVLLDAVLFVIRFVIIHKHIIRMRDQLQTIDAISSVYTSCLILRIDDDRFDIVKENGYVSRYVKPEEGIRQLAAALAKHCVLQPYRVEFRNFLERTTMAERLSENPVLEYTFQMADGKWCSSLLVVQQTGKDGRAKQVLFLIRDITEDKCREIGYQAELREAAEKSKAANEEKRLFLRRMSHDVRMPVSEIHEAAEIAKNYAAMPEKTERYMDKIMEIADYVLALVDDLMNLNRLEDGEWTTEIEEFHLLEIMQEMADSIENKLTESGVVLDVTEIDGVHWCVREDPRYVRRILEIIVSNALRYSRRGGTIRLGMKEVSFDGVESEFEFRCSFSGNGKEIQRYLYEPFSIDAVDGDLAVSGTGFGILFAKKLVQHMGGSIHFVSRIDEGTEVAVRLPFSVVQEKIRRPIMEEQRRNRSLAGKKVLLAEDNELLMEITRYLLERQGMTVSVAWNGQEALALFEHSQVWAFDLILLETGMPVMDGVAAVKAIRALPRADAEGLSVLAISTALSEEEQAELVKEGFDDCLQKPLQEKKLQQTLRAYCH